MRKLVATACLAAGTGLVALAGAQVTQAIWAQRAIRTQVSAWSDPSAPPAAQSSPMRTELVSVAPLPAPEREYHEGEPVFRLEIPRIDVHNIVVYGTSEAALKVGPGLVERTAVPGNSGNTVVAAHRDYYFWRLNELERGDELHVSSPDGAWTYVVTGKRVVKETQTEILDPTTRPTLTLFTCWPLIFAGHTPDRLVVTAERTVPDRLTREGK